MSELKWQIGDKYLTNENRVYEIDAIKGDRLFCISNESQVLVCHLDGNAVSGLEKLISLVDKSDNATYSPRKKVD